MDWPTQSSLEKTSQNLHFQFSFEDTEGRDNSSKINPVVAVANFRHSRGSSLHFEVSFGFYQNGRSLTGRGRRQRYKASGLLLAELTSELSHPLLRDPHP